MYTTGYAAQSVHTYQVPGTYVYTYLVFGMSQITATRRGQSVLSSVIFILLPEGGCARYGYIRNTYIHR